MATGIGFWDSEYVYNLYVQISQTDNRYFMCLSRIHNNTVTMQIIFSRNGYPDPMYPMRVSEQLDRLGVADDRN